jgi:hypothetical protein
VHRHHLQHSQHCTQENFLELSSSTSRDLQAKKSQASHFRTVSGSKICCARKDERPSFGRKNSAERARLYDLDMGVLLSPKQSSQRAAARSGLQLPIPYDEKDIK